MQTSKRRHWSHNAGPVAVVEPIGSFSELPDCSRVFVRGFPRGRQLSTLLAGEHVERYEDGHHAVVRRGERPCRQTITSAATWWPDDIAAVTCAAAWEWLQAALGRAWREPVSLLMTPGTTGRDLWLRTPAADDCPIMSADAQDTVRGSASQGRIETYPARAELLPGLYEYDMRIAYAAVLRNLPMGEPEPVGRIEVSQLGKRAARLYVRFRPPAGWRHVGILGVHHGAAGIDWPTEQRWHGPTWADGCEIDLALRHGWAIEVEHGLIWPTRGDPLRCWTDRLLGVLDRARRELTGDAWRAVRSMVRAIVLHTIGAFHGAPHRVTMTAASIADAPIGAAALRRFPDGSVQWHATTTAAWPAAVHPEWSAHVWARTRVRLLDHPAGGGMLHADPAVLVAVRTDAVYTSEPVGWEATDNGDVGRWVLKSSMTTPAPWPRTGLDVVALREGER